MKNIQPPQNDFYQSDRKSYNRGSYLNNSSEEDIHDSDEADENYSGKSSENSFRSK